MPDDPIVVGELDLFVGDGRFEDVATQYLEIAAVSGRDAGLGVETEAIDRVA